MWPTPFAVPEITSLNQKRILALRVHYALLLNYVPLKEPLGTPFENALRIK